MLYPRQQRPRLTSHGTIDTALPLPLLLLLLLVVVSALAGLPVLLLIAARCSSLRLPCARPLLRTNILITAAELLLLLLLLLPPRLLLLLLAQTARRMSELVCRTVSRQLTPLAMLNSL
jgi:hypothetical protein